jgi:hypothetical protein
MPIAGPPWCRVGVVESVQSELEWRPDNMRHLTGFTGCMLLSCIAIALTALPFDRATGAESLLSKYEHSDRRFEEYRTGDLLVYYHTRMLDSGRRLHRLSV